MNSLAHKLLRQDEVKPLQQAAGNLSFQMEEVMQKIEDTPKEPHITVETTAPLRPLTLEEITAVAGGPPMVNM